MAQKARLGRPTIEALRRLAKPHTTLSHDVLTYREPASARGSDELRSSARVELYSEAMVPTKWGTLTSVSTTTRVSP